MRQSLRTRFTWALVVAAALSGCKEDAAERPPDLDALEAPAAMPPPDLSKLEAPPPGALMLPATPEPAEATPTPLLAATPLPDAVDLGGAAPDATGALGPAPPSGITITTPRPGAARPLATPRPAPRPTAAPEGPPEAPPELEPEADPTPTPMPLATVPLDGPARATLRG